MAPLKERKTKFVLQQSDPTADRRNIEPERFGGSPKIPGIR
jgi:hypothetical protein